MYLKTIEIQGFKSFPDKIKIDYGQGITAIVGPNGSGKSNISDAVRWVLGEQSAKLLRGSKMEDVIFAGTEARKPLGFAEVALTIDNTDNILPIDYHEVTITRRVYRSGESEYYINKASCRLKDIHQLFMDTGLGKDGYSIIGQGRIDEILSSKSEDRRYIFEEASGISKYRYRKKESEKKLEQTRQNLVRITDIINELALQIEPLQEQSEKAKQYLDLRDELKEIEISVFLYSIDQLKTNLNEIEKTYVVTNEQLKNEEEKILSLENELQVIQDSLQEKELAIDHARKNFYSDEATLQRYKNDIELYKNNIQNNEENIKKLVLEMNEIVHKINNYKVELENKKLMVERLNVKKEAIQNEIDILEKKSLNANQIITSKNEEMDAFKSNLIDKMNTISEIRGKVNSVQVLEDNYDERKKGIDKEVDQKNNKLKQVSDLIHKLKYDYATNKGKIAETANNINRYLSNEKESREKVQAYQNDHLQKMTMMKEKASKMKLLQEMEHSYEGFYKSVKRILLEWENGSLKHLDIHGPVSKLIKVPDKYTTAIETVLGAAMQNIVVANENDAKIAIQFLKTKRLGRATFLPISSVKGNLLYNMNEVIKYPKCIGIAAQLIHYDEKYENIINSLLGRVVVVENIDDGIKMARHFGHKFRIVTLDGDILNPGGSMSGGSSYKSNGFLSRANDIKTLKEEVLRIRTVIETISNKKQKEENRLNVVTKQLEQEQIAQKELEAIDIKMESEIMYNQSIYENIAVTIEELAKENEQIQVKIKNNENEILQFSNTIEELEQEIALLEKQIAQKQIYFEDEISERDQLNQTIIDKKMELSSIEKDIGVCDERLNAIDLEISSYERDRDYKAQEHERLGQKMQQFEKDIKDKNISINTIQENLTLLQIKIDECIQAKQQTHDTINKHQTLIKQKRESISLLQQEHHRIENSKIKNELELENTINRLWDDYGQTYSEALTFKKEINNLSKAKNDITILKKEIKALGSINVNAIEEYKNVKERYEFLTTQRDDLEEAENSLMKIINDMVKLMNKQFTDKFKVINENFNLVFNELFGGGRATLTLTNTENVLESGIEIEVQPPGKKLQNLTLLSGGERAFTAIALLFAILKVRPTPFCILDEIEAALDDANVYRFAQYLKNYSDQTQFIIVTHRRGTMEMADILYGVTMQEKGVSKLLALNMDEVAS